LIKQYEVNKNCLLRGCNTAYSELESLISTRWDLTDEFAKKGFTNAAGTAVITGDSVSAVNVTYAGSNYGSVPAISFTGGGGTGAAATAVIENGIVTGINITNGGTGYTSEPTVIITGGAAPDTRTMVFVKIAAICAVRNALGNLQNIGESMLNNFAWADKAIQALRNAQRGMPTIKQSNTTTVGSPAELVNSSFNTLG
jgi:hypothetical protein